MTQKTSCGVDTWLRLYRHTNAHQWAMGELAEEGIGNAGANDRTRETARARAK